MKIAVCLASRGCVNSRTIESIFNECDGIEFKLFVSHDKPIPDAQNYLMQKSLEYDWDYQLWIEEDVVMPFGLVADMLCDFWTGKDINIISVPYPLSNGRMSIQFIKNGAHKGKFRFSGMGCMMIKRSLLNSIKERPFFSDKYAYNCNSSNGTSLTKKNRILFDPKGVKIAYALQDLYFWQILLDNGGVPYFKDVVCDHYRFVESGKKQDNDGCHTWEKIGWDQKEMNEYMEMVKQYEFSNKQ